MLKPIQIVMDRELLEATDKAARRAKQNRSAFVREAIREHLRHRDVRANEERDRRGYLRQPQAHPETHCWELHAVWPAE